MKAVSRLAPLPALLLAVAITLPGTTFSASQAPPGARGGARGGAAVQPATETPPITGLQPGNPAVGKALYSSHQCWACHGYNGETGGGTRLLNENATFSPRLVTVNSFINYLRAPRPDQAPPAGSSTAMPSYGVASLSDQQAADVYAYIKTFKPTQPAAKDIPLLNQMLGEGGKLGGK